MLRLASPHVTALIAATFGAVLATSACQSGPTKDGIVAEPSTSQAPSTRMDASGPNDATNGGDGGGGSVHGVDGGVSPVAMEPTLSPRGEPVPPPHLVLDCEAPPSGLPASVVDGWAEARLATPPAERGFMAAIALGAAPFAVDASRAWHPRAGDPVEAGIPLQTFAGRVSGAAQLEGYTSTLAFRIFMQVDAYISEDRDGQIVERGPGLVTIQLHGSSTTNLPSVDFARWDAEDVLCFSGRFGMERYPAVNSTTELPLPEGHTGQLQCATFDLDEDPPKAPEAMNTDLAGQLRESVRLSHGPVRIELEDASHLEYHGDDGSIDRPLNGYSRLTLEGTQGVWSSESGFYLSAEEVALDLDAAAVAITGSFSEGAVTIDDLGYPRPEDVLPPVSLHAPTFSGSASSVDGVQGEARLTQVVDDAGLLIPAAVELAPTELTLQVPSGGEIVEVVHVREASFRGDALLADIAIDASAPAGTFVLRGQQGAGSWAEQLVRAGQEGYLALPAVLVVTTLATAVETLATAFECVFTFGVSCGDEPETTLDTFPSALPAGQQDSFELAVHGTGEPGDTYTAELTFIGQNYCPVVLSVEVEIVAPEQSSQ